MTEDELDTWLSSPAINVRHSRTAPVSPQRLWDAASAVRLDETATVGRLVQWRLPGIEPQQTFRSVLAQDPFTVLEEGEHRSVSGMCGRIWTLSRDYPHLDGADDFHNWRQPGTVRVLFAHWVEPDGDRRSRLVSDVRVATVDFKARIAVRSLWALLGMFERLIGVEVLELAIRHATSTADPRPS